MDNTLLDKFADFPAKYTYGIVFGIAILAVVAYMFLPFLYPKKDARIKALDSELEKLRVELQKAENYAARYDEFKDQLRVVDLQLKEALKKLPEQEEIADLLEQINESGLSAGLIVSLFKPLPHQPQDFYSEVPVEIQAEGGYHNFARFADMISKMERIVTLRNIRLVPDPASPDVLGISCRAVTFKQSQGEATE